MKITIGNNKNINKAAVTEASEEVKAASEGKTELVKERRLCRRIYSGGYKKTIAEFIDKEKPAGQDYFNGEVIEASDDSVLVRCLDLTSGEVAEGDEVKVSLDVVAAGGAPKVAPGDKIRVVCNGVHRQQQEIVQLDTVFAIYMLDEDGEPIPN